MRTKDKLYTTSSNDLFIPPVPETVLILGEKATSLTNYLNFIFWILTTEVFYGIPDIVRNNKLDDTNY